ncbi:MAG TPA: class I SAM-dependent methyltransferase [Hellea balneolensis]|uniref:Class I SAM-dependent methyltransferase n=1 Tax=Hellea balneolensis TaxID=287478 RepID=A0A7C3GKV5_9PROT|nr:class I SAM-dependent methyltransferase [Hellea balneolensis]
MIYEDALLSFKQYPKAERHISEADFGYRYMSPAIRDLPDGVRILEVGSGSGLLIRRLAQEFPHKEFLGLEPMGDGFSYSQDIHNFVKSLANADIRPVGFEALEPHETFDLIYLVNVFEHFPDWKNFMHIVKRALRPQGRCIILCPNYSFPYEPHFRLPILVNKSVSFKFYKKRIEAFEQREDSHGLWKSLNFVKLRQVKHAAKKIDMTVHTHNVVLMDMIKRLDTDEEFAKRQGLLTWPVMIAQKTGLLKLVLTGRLFETWLPYMHLTLRNAPDGMKEKA